MRNFRIWSAARQTAGIYAHDTIEEAKEAAYNWLVLELDEGGELPETSHIEDMELPEGAFARNLMVRIKLLPDND